LDLDNKTVKEADRILINKGEVLRLVIRNNSMMRHPMHLHGHDFRVVNSQQEYSPLKNVIDIMPMETDTIEFAANQSGNWFFPLSYFISHDGRNGQSIYL
jgi:FtsP/CotA-like multicopper oxidase with cupredoxin domain